MPSIPSIVAPRGLVASLASAPPAAPTPPRMPEPAPASHGTALGPVTAAQLLSTARELDVTRDGRVGSDDVLALRADGQAWRSQQAAVLVAAATAGVSGSTTPASDEAAAAAGARELARSARSHPSSTTAYTGHPDATAGGVLAAMAPKLRGSMTPKELVHAIRQIDVRPLRAAGVHPIATFDVDGTSMRGDVFVPFAELSARRGLFASDEANRQFSTLLERTNLDPATWRGNDGNANAMLAMSLLHDPDPARAISIADFFYATGRALAGVPLATAQAAAHELVTKGFPGQAPYASHLNDDSPRPGDSVHDVTTALRHQGIEPWIVTYGFDFLAKELAPVLGIDPRHVVSTRLLVKDGLLTGELDDPSVRGKGEAIARQIGAVPLLAFGDSKSDVPMFDLAAVRAIAVNSPASLADDPKVLDGTYASLRYRGTTGDFPGS